MKSIKLSLIFCALLALCFSFTAPLSAKPYKRHCHEKRRTTTNLSLSLNYGVFPRAVPYAYPVAVYQQPIYQPVTVVRPIAPVYTPQYIYVYPGY